MTFPNLEDYRNAWIKDAESFNIKSYKQDPRKVLFETTSLKNLKIAGNRASVLKVFNGQVETIQGDTIRFDWQSLFFLVKNTDWQIIGFVGYMPHQTLSK